MNLHWLVPSIYLIFPWAFQRIRAPQALPPPAAHGPKIFGARIGIASASDRMLRSPGPQP